MADTLTKIRVGPEDNGRRMSFADFQRAEAVDGKLYELARGVIEVTDVPRPSHGFIVQAVGLQVSAYQLQHPDRIVYTAGGAGAKVELPGMESERHPDLSIYTTPMPDDEYPWDKWVPTLVIEVVSRGSEARQRDYVTKREEYLAAGVLEYWIVDPQERVMLALSRHGDVWRETRLAATDKWRTPRLPGFELDLAQVFAARG